MLCWGSIYTINPHSAPRPTTAMVRTPGWTHYPTPDSTNTTSNDAQIDLRKRR
jgi:hypothetical protein